MKSSRIQKSILLTSFLLLSGLNAQAQTQLPVLSLKDVISRAKQQNYEIRTAQNTLRQAENNEHPGMAGLLPQITATGGYNYSVNNTFIEFAIEGRPPVEQSGAGSRRLSANVGLNYTLFDGFANINNYSRSSEVTRQTAALVQSVSDNVLGRIIAGYFEVARLQEQLALAKRALVISQERTQRLTIRNNYGAATQAELLGAEVDKNSDSASVLAADLQYMNARRALSLLLASPDDKFTVDTAATFASLPPVDSLQRVLLRSNPQYQQAQQAIRIAELDESIAESQYFPRVTLNAQYGLVENRNDVGLTLLTRNVGFTGDITASFTLFDGGQRSVRSQNSSIALQSASLEKERVALELTNALRNAYDTYSMRRQLLTLEQANARTAETNFQIVRSSFELGQISGLQYREAQLNLLRTYSRLSEAKFAAKAAELEVLRLTGTFSEQY